MGLGGTRDRVIILTRVRTKWDKASLILSGGVCDQDRCLSGGGPPPASRFPTLRAGLLARPSRSPDHVCLEGHLPRGEGICISPPFPKMTGEEGSVLD